MLEAQLLILNSYAFGSSVPKVRLDELVREAKDNSPRNGDPDSPGRKRKRRPGPQSIYLAVKIVDLG